MKSKKPDNVIQLPIRQRETAQSEGAPAEPQAKPSSQPKAALPVWIPVTLAAVLTLTYVGNRISLSENSTDMASTSSESQRGIASIADRTDWNRNVKWEHEVAKNLAQAPSRELASVRAQHSVSLEDELRFSDLGSHYAVQFEDGQLSEIFLPQVTGTPNLAYFQREEFFRKYRKLLPPGVEFSNRLSREQNSQGMHETYAHLDQSNATIAETRVQLDPYGRLISLKVQAIR